MLAVEVLNAPRTTPFLPNIVPSEFSNSAALHCDIQNIMTTSQSNLTLEDNPILDWESWNLSPILFTALAAVLLLYYNLDSKSHLKHIPVLNSSNRWSWSDMQVKVRKQQPNHVS